LGKKGREKILFQVKGTEKKYKREGKMLAIQIIIRKHSYPPPLDNKKKKLFELLMMLK